MVDNVVGEQQRPTRCCVKCKATLDVACGLCLGSNVCCHCKLASAPSVAQDLIDNNKPLDPAIAAALNEDFLKLYEPVSPVVAVEDEARNIVGEWAVTHSGSLRVHTKSLVAAITAALTAASTKETKPSPDIKEAARRVAERYYDNDCESLESMVATALTAQELVGYRKGIEDAAKVLDQRAIEIVNDPERRWFRVVRRELNAQSVAIRSKLKE